MSHQGNADSQARQQTGDQAARHTARGEDRADHRAGAGDRDRQGAREDGGDDDSRRGRDSSSATGSTTDRAGGGGTR